MSPDLYNQPALWGKTNGGGMYLDTGSTLAIYQFVYGTDKDDLQLPTIEFDGDLAFIGNSTTANYAHAFDAETSKFTPKTSITWANLNKDINSPSFTGAGFMNGTFTFDGGFFVYGDAVSPDAGSANIEWGGVVIAP